MMELYHKVESKEQKKIAAKLKDPQEKVKRKRSSDQLGSEKKKQKLDASGSRDIRELFKN